MNNIDGHRWVYHFHSQNFRLYLLIQTIWTSIKTNIHQKTAFEHINVCFILKSSFWNERGNKGETTISMCLLVSNIRKVIGCTSFLLLISSEYNFYCYLLITLLSDEKKKTKNQDDGCILSYYRWLYSYKNYEVKWTVIDVPLDR